jgi:hypothetical protein
MHQWSKIDRIVKEFPWNHHKLPTIPGAPNIQLTKEMCPTTETGKKEIEKASGGYPATYRYNSQTRHCNSH